MLKRSKINLEIQVMLILIQNHLLKQAPMLESKLISKSLKENLVKTKMNCGKNIFNQANFTKITSLIYNIEVR